MLPGAPDRTAIGPAFDPASAAAAPTPRVTDNFGGTSGAPDWSGKVARLSGPDPGTYTEVVTDLPRPIKDHGSRCVLCGRTDPVRRPVGAPRGAATTAPDGSGVRPRSGNSVTIHSVAAAFRAYSN
ncbi:hypothetical protein K7G98_16365 [Saccharothrix sp. MB29]|nr:hypothetical protein [Saccharothrix sp. MB29]